MIEHFAVFFENGKGPFFLLSKEGVVEDLNKAAIELLNIGKKEIVGKSLEEFCPHQSEKFHRYLETCLRNSRPMPGSLTFQNAGSPLPCRTWGSSVGLKNQGPSERKHILLQGEPKESPQNRFVALNKKIKELQKSYQQLAHHSGLLEREIEEWKNYQKRLEKWELLFKNSRWGVASFNSEDFSIDMMNPEFARMHDWEPHELKGKNIFDLCRSKDQVRCRQCFHKALQGEKTTVECFHLKKNGNLFTVNMEISMAIEPEGQKVYGVVNIQDITERKKAEERLLISEENLKKAQELAHIGSWQLDFSDENLVWSEETYRIFGVPFDQPLTYRDFLNYVHPEDRPSVAKAWKGATEGKKYDIEHRILIGDHLKWVREKAEIERDQEGTPVLGIGTVQDITEQKLSEIVLQEREEWFRALFEGAPDAIFLADPDTGLVINANPEAEQLLKKPLGEIIGCHQRELHPKRMGEEVKETFSKHSQEKGPTQSLELSVLQSDGTEVPVEIRAHTVEVQGKPVIMGTFRDLTDRKRMEKEILKSLHEKEILLQEIHHRVKNNMALISALLRLQERYIDNELVHRVFQESQNRIQSMALVHEKLYNTQDFANINFRGYVMDLVRHLFQSYGRVPGDIALKMEIEDVSLGIDTMIPFGLILNEMVTNSIKHAFLEIPRPEIKILFRTEGDKYHFVYRDNGIGIPDHITFPSHSSLGLQILDMLSSQLRGSIELKRAPGTEFIISFGLSKKRSKG